MLSPVDPVILGGFDAPVLTLRWSAWILVPNQRYINEDNAKVSGTQQLGHAELFAAAYMGRDPVTYAEALKSKDADEWQKACQYKIDALHKNDTWELVNLPAGCKAVKSKWVFKLKADGHFHAWLVAKGFTQIPEIDYDKTFSPVAYFESLWLLLALAVLEDWHIHQMDVKLAFLNGMLDEEIYMEQPQGFIVAGMENNVCKLKKSIYGLKQASCTWNLQFHGFLLELGFKQTSSYAGVYVMHQSQGEDSLSLLIVILYVDDITIMGTSLEAVKWSKDDLQKCYEMSDLGEIESYLGICITWNRSHKCIEIDQSGYIKDVLDCFGMMDTNPHNIPLLAGADVHLVKNTEQASLAEIKHYQSLLGSLLYV